MASIAATGAGRGAGIVAKGLDIGGGGGGTGFFPGGGGGTGIALLIALSS